MVKSHVYQFQSQSLSWRNIGSEAHLISGMMLLQRVTMPLTDTSCSMSSGFRSLITFFCRRLNTFACTQRCQSTRRYNRQFCAQLAAYVQEAFTWLVVITQPADL